MNRINFVVSILSDATKSPFSSTVRNSNIATCPFVDFTRYQDPLFLPARKKGGGGKAASSILLLWKNRTVEGKKKKRTIWIALESINNKIESIESRIPRTREQSNLVRAWSRKILGLSLIYLSGIKKVATDNKRTILLSFVVE